MSGPVLEHFTTGDGRRCWRFLLDCPEIRATERPGINPPHAVTGDWLEEAEDEPELTPFRLMRGRVRIGSPEWWQVRHLIPAEAEAPRLTPARPAGLWRKATVYLTSGTELEGLEFVRSVPQFYAAGETVRIGSGWHLWVRDDVVRVGAINARAHTLTTHDFRELTRIHEVLTAPEYVAARRLLEFPDRAALVRKDVPGAGLRSGDVLQYVARTSYVTAEPGAAYGRARWLSLAEYEALYQAGAGEWLAPLGAFVRDGHTHDAADMMGGGRRGGRRQWGKNRKVWRSELRVVRAVPARVLAPIVARSDAEAVFELITAAGCRMPAPRQRT